MNNNKILNIFSVMLGVFLFIFTAMFIITMYGIIFDPENTFSVLVAIGSIICIMASIMLIYCGIVLFTIPSNTEKYRVALKSPKDPYLTLVPDQYNDFSEEILQRELQEKSSSRVNIVA